MSPLHARPAAAVPESVMPQSRADNLSGRVLHFHYLLLPWPLCHRGRYLSGPERMNGVAGMAQSMAW